MAGISGTRDTLSPVHLSVCILSMVHSIIDVTCDSNYYYCIDC